ncbi:C_GCAxxG_C_C family protein [bacterium]|nr:C_GCAxxG_C_C family protein [bacterium]
MSEKDQNRSRELFDSGFYCAESVLLAVAEHYQIQSDIIPKIATGFCGGMALKDGYCGALTGGVLAINIISGRKDPDIAVDTNFRLVQQFLERFHNKYHSRYCTEILQCNLSRAEELTRFRSSDMIETCKQVVEETTGMVIEVLQSFNEVP